MESQSLDVVEIGIYLACCDSLRESLSVVFDFLNLNWLYRGVLLQIQLEVGSLFFGKELGDKGIVPAEHGLKHRLHHLRVVFEDRVNQV